MFFQIKSYLKFLWYSKNEHAVHSPFVFTLITKCFYDKKSKPEYEILNHYRKKVLANTNSLAVGNPKGKTTTIEGCPETAKIAQNQFQDFHLSNITSVVTEFENYLDNLKKENSSFNLVYFDGNHSKKATLSYFEKLLPTATNETVWIFDDIHWSADMEEAWESIKKHPKVTVTIDTFQWGLVFFRREQPKEHFVIRV